MRDHIDTCKMNHVRKVIELKSSSIDDSVFTDSDIIVYYNMADGMPLILCERGTTVNNGIDIMGISVEGFTISMETTEVNGITYTDIICVRKGLYDAIIEREKEEIN